MDSFWWLVFSFSLSKDFVSCAYTNLCIYCPYPYHCVLREEIKLHQQVLARTVFIKTLALLGMVVHVYNSRTWDAEVGGSPKVWDQPGLQRESWSACVKTKPNQTSRNIRLDYCNHNFVTLQCFSIKVLKWYFSRYLSTFSSRIFLSILL